MAFIGWAGCESGCLLLNYVIKVGLALSMVNYFIKVGLARSMVNYVIKVGLALSMENCHIKIGLALSTVDYVMVIGLALSTVDYVMVIGLALSTADYVMVIGLMASDLNYFNVIGLALMVAIYITEEGKGKACVVDKVMGKIMEVEDTLHRSGIQVGASCTAPRDHPDGSRGLADLDRSIHGGHCQQRECVVGKHTGSCNNVL